MRPLEIFGNAGMSWSPPILIGWNMQGGRDPRAE
jgi:hypothetical protein